LALRCGPPRRMPNVGSSAAGVGRFLGVSKPSVLYTPGLCTCEPSAQAPEVCTKLMISTRRLPPAPPRNSSELSFQIPPARLLRQENPSEDSLIGNQLTVGLPFLRLLRGTYTLRQRGIKPSKYQSLEFSIQAPVRISFAPRDTPRLHEISLDSRAVLITLILCLLSAVLFGLAPAFRLASTASALGVRDSGIRHARRTRDLLVIVECGVAIVLLAGAGVLTMKFHSPISNDPTRFQQLVSRLESLPGGEAAGGISRYFQVNAMHTAISIDGQPPLDPASAPMINFDVIGGHYLQAIGVPLLRGPLFLRGRFRGSAQSSRGQSGIRRPLPSTRRSRRPRAPPRLRPHRVHDHQRNREYAPAGRHQRADP
jgi:hypothetical protein